MPSLSTLRSPFQVSSSAVTPYIIHHKPLRIQVKHCPHGFLNQLLHNTATERSQNALCQVWMQYLPLLRQRNEAVHEYSLPALPRLLCCHHGPPPSRKSRYCIFFLLKSGTFTSVKFDWRNYLVKQFSSHVSSTCRITWFSAKLSAFFLSTVSWECCSHQHLPKFCDICLPCWDVHERQDIPVPPSHFFNIKHSHSGISCLNNLFNLSVPSFLFNYIDLNVSGRASLKAWYGRIAVGWDYQ